MCILKAIHHQVVRVEITQYIFMLLQQTKTTTTNNTTKSTTLYNIRAITNGYPSIQIHIQTYTYMKHITISTYNVLPLARY